MVVPHIIVHLRMSFIWLLTCSSVRHPSLVVQLKCYRTPLHALHLCLCILKCVKTVILHLCLCSSKCHKAYPHALHLCLQGGVSSRVPRRHLAVACHSVGPTLYREGPAAEGRVCRLGQPCPAEVTGRRPVRALACHLPVRLC